MAQNEVILILSPTESISLATFTARDVMAILNSAVFIETKLDASESSGYDLYRYDESKCETLSFLAYYKIRSLYWVPYEVGKLTVNWDDWFISRDEPPHINDQPADIMWRNPTYEEAITRQAEYNLSPSNFARIMAKNIDHCDIRQYLMEQKKLKWSDVK
jgi:hypothetical protein